MAKYERSYHNGIYVSKWSGHVSEWGGINYWVYMLSPSDSSVCVISINTCKYFF